MPTRPLASGTGFELRALLSNQRSILARVGKTYNTSLQICTCCSQSSRRKAHSFLTLGRNSCGGCLARNILGSSRREAGPPPLYLLSMRGFLLFLLCTESRHT